MIFSLTDNLQDSIKKNTKGDHALQQSPTNITGTGPKTTFNLS